MAYTTGLGETEPGCGKPSGFAMFCQVLVLFSLGLNGFALSFGREKTDKKVLKKYRKTQEMPGFA